MALKQKTVYFREEDLDKWEAIPNKAEWLHEMLNLPQIPIAKIEGYKVMSSEPTLTEPEETA